MHGDDLQALQDGDSFWEKRKGEKQRNKWVRDKQWVSTVLVRHFTTNTKS